MSTQQLDVYKEWLGIPEGPRPPDHYQLLRLVRFEDSVEKIRSNYKKLNAHVRKYATGQYSIESQELLNELAKAMLCLTDAERKREYDKSLGREVEEDYGPLGRKPMEVFLVEQGHLTQGQLEEARAYADKTGLSVRDALVQMKLVDPAVAAQALAQACGLPYMDLGDMIPDDSVLDRVPRKTVKQHSILPLFIDDDRLLVACVDEPEPELEEDLRLRFGVPVRGVIATPLAINQGIAKYYAPGARQEVADEVPKGDGAAKKAAAKPQKKPKVRKRSYELTPEEQHQRKMIGIVAICWSVILSVGLDYFLLPLDWSFRYLFTFLIPPIVFVAVWKGYWGK